MHACMYAWHSAGAAVQHACQVKILMFAFPDWQSNTLEEVRLAYVGATRAEEKLYITHCKVSYCHLSGCKSDVLFPLLSF